MAKYIANPVEVEAFQLVTVGPVADQSSNERNLKLDNGDWVQAGVEMMSRMTPQVGDYWVIQSDGYVYLNPKDVFERRYRLA